MPGHISMLWHAVSHIGRICMMRYVHVMIVTGIIIGTSSIGVVIGGVVVVIVVVVIIGVSIGIISSSSWGIVAGGGVVGCMIGWRCWICWGVGDRILSCIAGN